MHCKPYTYGCIFICIIVFVATLKKSTVDSVQVFNERLMQEMRTGANANPAENVRQDDNHSVESLDSLDSEQPSFRSHDVNPNSKQSNNNNNSNLYSSELSGGGGDTYRQESSTVLVNDDQGSNSTLTHPAAAHKQSTRTSSTPMTDANSFHGFQVVNTNGRLAKRDDAAKRQALISNLPIAESLHAQPSEDAKQVMYSINQNSDQNGDISLFSLLIIIILL